MTTEAQHTLLNIKNNLSFFKNIGDSSILNITKDVKYKKYRPNELVFNQNSDKDLEKIYCVLLGRVDILIGKNDNTDRIKDFKKIAELKKFEVFGEISAFTKIKRTAQIKAGDKGATILVFSIDFSKEHSDPAFVVLYKNFIRDLGKKLSTSNNSFYEVI